jgi:hypothetical protein
MTITTELLLIAAPAAAQQPAHEGECYAERSGDFPNCPDTREGRHEALFSM